MIACSTSGTVNSSAKVTSPSTIKLEGPTTTANRSGTAMIPGCAATTRCISRRTPESSARFALSSTIEATRSTSPIKALAAVSGAALPVSWVATRPAAAVIAPSTAHAPPMTTVKAAGSVLLCAWARSEIPLVAACFRIGFKATTRANVSSATVVARTK